MKDNQEIKNWDGVEVEEVAVDEVTEHISASARSCGAPFYHWWFCSE